MAFWAFEGTSASIATGKFWATMSDITMVRHTALCLSLTHTQHERSALARVLCLVCAGTCACTLSASYVSTACGLQLTKSAPSQAEDFAPITAQSCVATPIAACADADITAADRAAAQTSCEDAGACTFTEAATAWDGSATAASCTTTAIQACTDADLSTEPEAACQAAGACTYEAGPAQTWGPYGMGPSGCGNGVSFVCISCCEKSDHLPRQARDKDNEGLANDDRFVTREFPVPDNQPDSFYEQGQHAGMAGMAPPAVACSTCMFGSGHAGTPATNCRAGCDTSSGCSTIACSAATADETTCETAGTDAGIADASCVFTPANPTPPFGTNTSEISNPHCCVSCFFYSFNNGQCRGRPDKTHACTCRPPRGGQLRSRAGRLQSHENLRRR